MNLNLNAIKRRLGQAVTTPVDFLKQAASNILKVSPIGLAQQAYQKGPQIEKAVTPYVEPIVKQAKELYTGATTLPLSPEDIPFEKQTPAYKLGSAISFAGLGGAPSGLPKLAGKIPSLIGTGGEILQAIPRYQARGEIVKKTVSKIPGLEKTPIPGAVAFVEPFISDNPAGAAKSLRSMKGFASNLLKPEPLYESDLHYVGNALKDLSGKVNPTRFYELEKTANAYNEGYKLAGKKEWLKMDLQNKYRLISRKLTDVYNTYYQGERPILQGFVKGKPAQESMIPKIGEGQVTGAENKLAMEKLLAKKSVGKGIEETPIGKELEKTALKEQMGGGLFPEEAIKPTAEEIAKAEEQMLAEARMEFMKEKPFGDYQKDFDRHVKTVRLLGEKTSKKTGELYREHIPRSGVLSSSDEVASDLGMSEADYMQKVLQEAGVAGGEKVVMPKMPRPIRISEAIPKGPKPPKFQKPRQVPYAYGQTQMMIEGKPVSIHPTIMKKIVDRQLNKINVLRKKANLPLRTFKQFVHDLTGKTSVKKLTYQETKEIKGVLTPPKTEEFKANIEKVRELSLDTKVKSFKEMPEVAKLEKDTFGIKDFFDKIKLDISTFAENVKELGKPSKIRETPLQLLLAESTAAKLGGIKPFQVKVKNIVDLAENYRRNFNNLLTNVFADLSKEDAKAVLKRTSGVQEKNISSLIKERAELLQNIFRENLKITNKLRELRGLKPIPERKSYIPFYLQPEFREAFGLSKTFRFDIERTKTNKELLAGLFSLEPKVLIEKYVDASAKFIKRNLYGAFLSDKSKDWTGKSSFAQILIDKNIMDIPGALQKLSQKQAEGINGLLAKIFPKQLRLAPDLQKVLRETSFYEDATFKKQIDAGVLSAPRFTTPNLTEGARDTFILSNLAFNTRFFVTNLMQTLLGIPFTGGKNFAKGELKILSAWMPKNNTELKNLNGMLTELGSMSDRMVTGEELAIHHYTINAIMKTLGIFARLSELHNRLSTGITGTSFLRDIETKTGMKFTPRDFNKIVNEYVTFLHFRGGKGYSAIASRNPIGKLAYVFQQYGLYVLRVFGQQLKVAFKDEGLKEFWKMMAEEGGASNKAKAIFDKMPVESKLRIVRLVPGMLGSATMIYVLTGSWGAFTRLLPLQGITPDTQPAAIQIATAILSLMKSPDENKFKALEDLWKNTFDITQIKRLQDAYALWQEGKIVDETGKVMYQSDDPNDVWKIAFWGRGITFENAIDAKNEVYKRTQEIKRDREKINTLIRKGKIDEARDLAKEKKLPLRPRTIRQVKKSAQKTSLERSLMLLPKKERGEFDKYIIKKKPKLNLPQGQSKTAGEFDKYIIRK